MAFIKKTYTEGQTVITAQNLNDINNFLGGGTGNLADYVVEQGTSGIWTYRKWASGLAECWARKEISSVAVTSAWGGLYESADIGSIAYPGGLFVAQPIFSSSVSKTKRYSAAGIETDGGSASATPALYLLRATAGTIQGVEISLEAKGRWKE